MKESPSDEIFNTRDVLFSNDFGPTDFKVLIDVIFICNYESKIPLLGILQIKFSYSTSYKGT